MKHIKLKVEPGYTWCAWMKLWSQYCEKLLRNWELKYIYNFNSINIFTPVKHMTVVSPQLIYDYCVNFLLNMLGD